MSSLRSPLSYLYHPLVSLLSVIPFSYLKSDHVDSSAHRLEITSNTTIECGLTSARMIGGYAHIDNGSMYWLYFPSPNPEVQGLTIHHNGGPASSMDHPFIGAGPCQITPEGELVEAPYPWTDVTNLLILDIPLGSGWSYTDNEDGIANSSSWAAAEVDDALQLFMRKFPRFVSEPLVYHSLSYGGTYIPHVLTTMSHRNTYGGPNRIRKTVDHVFLTNPFSDIMTHMRWSHNSSCLTEPAIYPPEICDRMALMLPACEDALDIALEDSTVLSRMAARDACVLPDEVRFGEVLANGADRRKPKCSSMSDCYWWWDALPVFLNNDKTKKQLGVKADLTWTYMGKPAARFFETADKRVTPASKHVQRLITSMQSAYRMFEPVVNSGINLTVMSALPDSVCPWQGNLAWMSKLRSSRLSEFRESPLQTLPDHLPAGWQKGVEGYQMIAVEHGSHLIELEQPELMQRMVGRMIRGQALLGR